MSLLCSGCQNAISIGYFPLDTFQGLLKVKLGQRHLTPNPDFGEDLQGKVLHLKDCLRNINMLHILFFKKVIKSRLLFVHQSWVCGMYFEGKEFPTPDHSMARGQDLDLQPTIGPFTPFLSSECCCRDGKCKSPKQFLTAQSPQRLCRLKVNLISSQSLTIFYA